MSPHRACRWVTATAGAGILACLALTATAQPQLSEFIVSYGGPAYPTPYGGYVVATLADIQSSDFTDAYNPFGLPVPPYEPMGVAYCSFLSVAEGFLAFGTVSNVSIVGPYSGNGTWETGQMLNGPIWFGLATGNGDGMIGPMSKAQQQLLSVQPTSTCSELGWWTIYRLAHFYIGRTGSGYTGAPPSLPNGVLATSTDILSPAFVYQYNANGLPPLVYGGGLPNGCCAVKTANGWLTFGDYRHRSQDGVAFVVPHYATSDGSAACDGSGFASMTGEQRFSTQWGNGNQTFLENLDAEDLRDFGTQVSGPSQCDSDPENSFAVFKASKSSVTPSPGECFELQVSMGYYTLTNWSCVAVRWQYYTYNDSASNVTLDSFNTCGGSQVANGFSITAFNQQYASVNVQSVSGCSGCSASDKLIPMDGNSTFNTICQITIGEFGWCNLVIAINKKYNCPTPSP